MIENISICKSILQTIESARKSGFMVSFSLLNVKKSATVGYIYRLCADGSPYYIGSTLNPFNRLMLHVAELTPIRLQGLYQLHLYRKGIRPRMEILSVCPRIDRKAQELATISEYRNRGIRLVNVQYNSDVYKEWWNEIEKIEWTPAEREMKHGLPIETRIELLYQVLNALKSKKKKV